MKTPKMKTITQEECDILRANFQLLTKFFSERARLLEELKEAYLKLCRKRKAYEG